MNGEITNRQNPITPNARPSREASEGKAHPLRAAFEKLPKAVRDWLTSDQVNSTIVQINKRLDLVGELVAIIPNYLILRLLAKGLAPQNFASEMATELDIELSEANNLTLEIYQKILKPIEAALLKEGVDVGLIAKISSVSAGAPPTIQPPSPKPPVIPPRTFNVPSAGIMTSEELTKGEGL